MTDRIRTLHITLDKDIRTDDVETIKTAISMIKGVSTVQSGETVGLNEILQRDIALREFILMQIDFLRLAMPAGEKDRDRFQQMKALLDAFHREKYG